MKLFSKNILFVLLIMMVMAGVYSLLAGQMEVKNEIPISQIVSEINGGNVKSIGAKGDNLEVIFADGKIAQSKKEAETSLTDTLMNYGVSAEQLVKVSIDIKSPSGSSIWLGTVLPLALPIIIIVLFFWLAARQVKKSNFQSLTFGKTQARVIEPDDKKEKVTFKDVAGAHEVKEELQEIVEFLRNPKKFLDIGARIPKGVLLMGPPGSGKTLLARAVAGESNVPFFHVSGSEFVELFVGIGASRVRDLFKVAKTAAPAIIFIDEIDAVGRHRGTGLGGGNDEMEQTLNQILVEMDGFEPHEKVIVIAATNRPDVLDPALLRPGRFDRKVTLDLPDRPERAEILAIHSKNKPLAKNVNLEEVAKSTPGLSGADLRNVANEAAILAARDNRKKIEQKDFRNSIEKVLISPESTSHLMKENEKKIVAYHEAGHAIIGHLLADADEVHKVSIISRGMALGFTLSLPKEDNKLIPKSQFEHELARLLGGRAAEELIFKEVTTGASNDLERATEIARNMVMVYGMSELGPVKLGEREEMVFLGREMGMHRVHSEKVAAKIDEEISRLIDMGWKTAVALLKKEIKTLHHMAHELLEKETLEDEDLRSVFATLKVAKHAA